MPSAPFPRIGKAAKTVPVGIRNDVSDFVVTSLANDVAAFRARNVLDVSSEGFSYVSVGMLSGVAINQDGVWRFL
ncbi:MAG: hypothetical protein JNJ73_13645 [Hyphomonadaceae bacterium]|nr:hypothetical protein [Hyphomonadaceae bacterium]